MIETKGEKRDRERERRRWQKENNMATMENREGEGEW